MCVFPFLLHPDSEGGWWKAISLSTGRESYIPGICVARVYHGWLFEGLGRDKAEELLQLPDTKIGSFMIRESETKKGELFFFSFGCCLTFGGTAHVALNSLAMDLFLFPHMHVNRPGPVVISLVSHPP